MEPFLVPAAAYLRKSTDDQQFSITNQKSVIESYAQQHGFDIVCTYTDAGKSGLVLKYRKGLTQLLQDVMDGTAQYKAILVYDVSRWGRFQDADESAYYEFICKQANIPVHYCAELFTNNNTLPSAIFKALKRTMAAEFSRELSTKVSQGLRRLSALGFRTTGTAGYGLRRMLISADGRRKQVLRLGERKSITTDRVILIPGPKREVACVREVFRNYAYRGMGVSEIVRDLNRRGISSQAPGRTWTTSTVSRMLQNPKYIGVNIWGRTTVLLKAQRQRVTPPSSWVIKKDAFEPVIDKATFDRVQRIFGRRRSKHYKYSDTQLLRKLKRLIAKKGKVTQQLIERHPGPSASTYFSRFGSLRKSYALAGYEPLSNALYMSARGESVKRLRRRTLKRIEKTFSKHIQLIRLPGTNRDNLLIDGNVAVTVALCRTEETPLRHRRWAFRIMPREIRLPCLVCLCNHRLDAIEHIYLFPTIAKAVNYQAEFRIKEGDLLFRLGTRLNGFRGFYPALRRLISRKLIQIPNIPGCALDEARPLGTLASHPKITKRAEL